MDVVIIRIVIGYIIHQTRERVEIYSFISNNQTL
jgi:hypothetical protein